MELHQLTYLVAVAEEASFTRAAARVHVAQPGVSAQIRRLEAELGHELFDRSGRRVRLTEVGAAVLPHARAALAAVAGARQAVDDLAGLLRGRVSVGVVVGCSLPDLADVLAAFHRRHPDVELSVAEAGSDELVAGLRSGRFDLAVIGVGLDDPGGVEVGAMVTEPLVAAVARDHPLAGRSHVRLAGLADQPIICLPRGTGLRTSVDAAARRAGVELRVALEASDPGVVLDLAARGLGVAVLARSIAASRDDVVQVVAIRPTVLSRLALAWPTDAPLGPAARVLLEQARRRLVPDDGEATAD